MNRTQWIATGRRLHRVVGWLAALALVWFIISGLLHILMVWTGPQSARFFPPQASVAADELTNLPVVLSAADISAAQLVQVVPTADGNALQITESDEKPRRYFSLQSGEEWLDYDQQQARWLARYFTGLEKADIVSVDVQYEFDEAYPWVNRLLPVYRVSFATPDQLTAYVYTEFAALAGLTNNWKNSIQSWFQNLHTWEWLAFSEPLRVTVMLILLGSVVLMVISGVLMRLVVPSRRIPQTGRRWHRHLAWWIVIPVLAFLISGIWHLLMYAGGERQQGLRLPQAVNIQALTQTASADWPADYQDQSVQSITLLQGPNNQPLYRVALPEGDMNHKPGHHQRFNGQASEQPAHYYNVTSGESVSLTDKDIARDRAMDLADIDTSAITGISRVNHFSPEYDFRNKRLPVWRVDFDDKDGTTLFIDVASGMQVDKTNAAQRLEGNVFATLHKWAQLGHLWGQGPRDVLMLFVVLIMTGFAVLGIRMLLRR